MSTPLYRDTNASIEERVENVLSLMTLNEKLAQPGCLWSTAFVRGGNFDLDAVAAQMPHGIGASSDDIRAEQTVTLTGQVVEYQRREIVDTKVVVV